MARDIVQWTVTTSGGSSVASTEVSSDTITGWIEGFKITSDDNVDAGITGTLREVGGLEDDLWAGTIGSDNTIRKYPVHEESSPDDADPGTNRLFYLTQQQLRLILASAGATPGQVTITVKFIPDHR